MKVTLTTHFFTQQWDTFFSLKETDASLSTRRKDKTEVTECFQVALVKTGTLLWSLGQEVLSPP